MREHLDVTKSDRGFNFMPPIAGGYGGAVKVYESSGATAPHIWLQATNPEGQEVHLHLAAEDAWHLAEQISHLVEHHYQGDARPAAVTPEPAGPRLREWTGSEGGHIYEVQPGWAIWAVSREEAEAEHARYNLGVQCSYGIKVEDLAYHGATEVPAVPPAEPGAGA